MLTNLSKNVLYVKDIKSNVIEEAFFVLKNNNIQNEKVHSEIAIGEINDIIDTFLKAYSKENDTKKAKAKDELKRTKIVATFCAFAFVISCVIMMLIGQGLIN